MELISRAEAIACGLKRYFTGKPCAHGHISERHVRRCECLACRRDWEAPPEERKLIRDQKIARQALDNQQFCKWCNADLPFRYTQNRRKVFCNDKCRTAYFVGVRTKARLVARLAKPPREPKPKKPHKPKCSTVTRATKMRAKAKDPKRWWAMRAVGRCRARAEKAGVPFDLTIEDILPLMVSTCPVFGESLVYGEGRRTDANASLDRIHPKLGYVPGNIVVISLKANQIKSNASYEELVRLTDWLGITTHYTPRRKLNCFDWLTVKQTFRDVNARMESNPIIEDAERIFAD